MLFLILNMKNKIVWLVMVFILFPGLASARVSSTTTPIASVQEVPASTLATSSNEYYKSIVSIKSFILDNDFNLTKVAIGSGIIISKDGLVLTNNHVVEFKDDFDNSDREVGYQVCLPLNTTEEPDCSYSARLVAKNKDLDIAMLKLEPISGMSEKIQFDYLTLNEADVTNINDEVTAIGYPDIGGSTVTITKGIISGKTEKYKKKWIKTDAVISFGSSGGAAIDKNGKVIGITSAGHADFLGSLGYIINVDTINKWINDNKSGKPRAAFFQNRIANFSVKEKKIKKENTFTFEYPNISISKNPDWEFKYNSENSLEIVKADDEEAGGLMLILSNENLITDIKRIKGSIALQNKEQEVFLNVKEGMVGGFKSISHIANMYGADVYYVYIPYKEYVIMAVYSNGTEEKNKAEMEAAIKSIKIKDDKSAYKELREYNHQDPNFKVNTGGTNLVVKKNNSKKEPVFLTNKKYSNGGISIEIEKLSSGFKDYTDAKYLDYLKKQISNQSKNTWGDKIKVLKTDLKYKINNKVNAIRISTEGFERESNKHKYYQEKFYVRNGDKYIIISHNMEYTDKKVFDEVFGDLKKVFSTLTIGKTLIIDSDNDGLSDVDEKKYGTDLKNSDSDGDGFLDGAEVKNGYNPLGFGKLKK